MRTLTVLSVVGLLAFTSCVSEQAYKDAIADKEAAEKTLADMAGRLDQVTGQRNKLSSQNQTLAADAVSRKQMIDTQARLDAMLEKLRGSGAKLPGVTMFTGPTGNGVRVEGQIVFASGKAAVTDSGKELLRQLVTMLNETGKNLQVVGHTDTDPIRHSAGGKWVNNLELSALRGAAVATFLISQGVPAERVSVAGYGQWLPVDPADSTDAKALNRRVEIMIRD